MRVRGGKAIFMAECSHMFHFHCIAASDVAHGHTICPICNAPWRELPFERLAASVTSPPTQPPLQPPSVNVVQLPLPPGLTTQPADPVVFDDDEQANGAVIVNTYTDTEDTVVARPEHAADVVWSVEVQRERELFPVEATEDIASATAAEGDTHQEGVIYEVFYFPL
jgi:hypothetical protein